MGIYLSKDGISYLWAKIKNKFYTKPSGGIPKSDLASSVQTSLGKADSALQSHQDISGKQDKLTAGANITISGNTISAKDTTYSNASTTAAGLMTAADKAKLDGMDLSQYLPLAGGTMSGNIDMATNQKDVFVGLHRAGVDNITPVAGGSVSKKESIETGLPNRRSLTGSWLDQNSVWHNILSIRHRNGWNDGPNYGFYLRSLLTSDSDLYWNKQTGKDKWVGERKLLDSANYANYAAKKDHTHSIVDKANALEETEWTDVPETDISPRYGKNIKYLKSGNTVYVRGSISFSQSLNTPCCGTMPSDLLPDDYQDHVFTAWNLLGGVPTAYPVVLAKDGKITLMNPTSAAQWFVAGRAYNFNFNYHIK